MHRTPTVKITQGMATATRKRTNNRPATKAEAQAMKELALAEKQQITVAEMKGELVDRALAEKVVTEAAAAVAERINAIPDRLAPELAQEKSPKRIRLMLKDELDRALRSLLKLKLD